MGDKPVDTAITMIVGPLIDDSDFKSLEEAIAYNAVGMDVSLITEKTDGTTIVTAITLTTGGTSDWTHKDGGYYEVEITAAQNTEEGIGYVRGVCTGVLPFESAHYNIVPTMIYDSLIKGSDKLEVDAVEISGDGVAAGNLELDYLATGFAKPNSTIGTCTTNSDMVGTNGANTTTPPTVTEIRTKVEEAGSTLATIAADTNELQTDWKDTGRLDNLLDAIPTTAMRGTDSVPTNPLLTNDTRLNNLDATISTRSTVTTAQVNEQVVDVMKTDVTAEMVQAAPPATPTFEEMIAYIYFRLRNKCETTSTEDSIYNNAGDTKLFKAAISDNGIVFTKAEYVSGSA